MAKSKNQELDNGFFGPIKISKEQSTRLKEMGKGDSMTKSALIQYQDPELESYKNRVFTEMWSGRLNSIIKVKIRQGVEATLKKTYSGEEVENNWNFKCQRIIEVHLYNTRSEFKAFNFPKSEIIDLKKRFPLQFQLLKEINGWIDIGRTAEQIEQLILLK